MNLSRNISRHIFKDQLAKQAHYLNNGTKTLSGYSRASVHRILEYNITKARSSRLAQPVVAKSQRILFRFNHNQSTRKVEHFILPDIGEGINEVIIKEWQVKLGDQVKEFDEICTVESDKATATISSRYEGVIKVIHYDVGATAKVGTPLVDIETKSSTLTSLQNAPLEGKENQVVESNGNHLKNQPEERAQSESGRLQVNGLPVAVLPSVRRLAKEYDIDLGKIKPTGKNGRILKEDVLAYLEKPKVDGTLSAKTTKREPIDAAKGIELETIVPLSRIQRAMHKTMTQSLTIPHFSYSDDIDMTRLIEVSRNLSNSRVSSSADSSRIGGSSERIGNFAFIIKMVSLALCEYPQLNASLSDNGESIIQKNYHNIGIAVDTQAGLVVPNIKNVQSLSIKEINLELTRLRELGYASKLSPNDLTGGTVTLSNIGAIGGVFGVPVIVAPEIVIGAIGRTRALPRFNEKGSIEQRHIMQLVWSADHRVVDGATLSRFTNLLKKYLENPEEALIKLS